MQNDIRKANAEVDMMLSSMEQASIQDAYLYLNNLDHYKISLIPAEVWQYFEKRVDLSKINKMPKEIKKSAKIKDFVNYIEQTYFFF